MTSRGLASFVAMVDLQAASSLGSFIIEDGPVLPFCGFVLATKPRAAGFVFVGERFWINPIPLLGTRPVRRRQPGNGGGSGSGSVTGQLTG